MSSSVSTTAFGGYDNLGRPGSSSQATPSTAAAYNFSYQYQPAGLKQMTYPSSRVVSYMYDGAGRESSVASGATTYASQIQYAPHGGTSSLQLGNLLFEQTCYNNRLQATGVRLGPGLTDATHCTSSNDTVNLQFGFGTANNNGNVTGQSIYAGGPTYSQTYQYTDGLNRLTNFSETGGWTQAYSYDPLGNRSVSGTIPRPDWTPTSLGNYSGNRWVRGTGDAYDAAGNQTGIASTANYSASASVFSFDGESRMTGANVANMGSTSYQYDGDGRRVVKSNSAGTTTYYYDAMGRLAAEYGTATNPAPGTEYLTGDHLGSTRVVTGPSGAVVRRYDYLRFRVGLMAAGRNMGLRCIRQCPMW